MAQLKTTPLTQWHRDNGGRMVPFAGFEMPVQYEGILAEHLHTRAEVSAFDICHMGEFKLWGAQAREALSTVVTHNLATLGPGRCRYGYLLGENGGIIDDLIVYCLSDGEYMLVVNGSRAAVDYETIRARLPQGLHFEDVSDNLAKIDVQGPRAAEVVADVTGVPCTMIPYFGFKRDEFMADPLLVSRTGYTGELGFELYCRVDRAMDLWLAVVGDERVRPAGLGARDTLRLEIGLPLYGQDLDEEHTPAEAGGAMFLKSEADYVGKAHALDVRERLVPLALEGRRSARHDDPVHLPGGEKVGRVTSGSFGPSLGHAVALAYIEAAHADAGEYVIRTGRAELAARKSELPFYKDGTVRMKL